MCISHWFSIDRHAAVLMLGLLLLGEAPVLKAGGQAASSASVGLSPVPPDLLEGKGATPNLVVTMDSALSMYETYSPELRPFDSGGWNGPWKCAGAIDPRITDAKDIRSRTMNGVYYNPNVSYLPPVNANGTLFQDATPENVPVEAIAAYRPRKPLTQAGVIFRENRPSSNGSNMTPDGAAGKRDHSANLAGKRTVERITKTRTESRTVTRSSSKFCPASSRAGERAGFAMGCACEVTKPKQPAERFEVSAFYTLYNYDARKTRTHFRLVCRSLPGALGGSVQFTWTDIEDVQTEYQEERQSDSRWLCGADTSSPVSEAGGGYYYRYKQGAPKIEVDSSGEPTAAGLGRLYSRDNWEAVAVDDRQNFANWYAYYRTPALAMRTSLSRAFGRLAGGTGGSGYGSSAIRVAWQDLKDDFYLSDDAIISPLTDANAPACKARDVSSYWTATDAGKVKTSPNCYRSGFFDWLFDDSYFAVNPAWPVGLRDRKYKEQEVALTARTNKFFARGNGNTGATGDFHDPYWEPPATPGTDGRRLTCRQNFHMVFSDRTSLGSISSSTADGNVHTTYFNPGNSQNLIGRISKTLTGIIEGTLSVSGGKPKTSAAAGSKKLVSAVNASVLVPGALAFATGYDAADWSGTLQAIVLAASGESSAMAWDAGAILDDSGRTNPAARNILTARWNNLGRSAGVAFKLNSELDLDSRHWFDEIGRKAGATGQDVIDYLRGDRGKEGTAFRKREHLLGAIIGSQAVYVGRPSSGYRNSWPASSPEQRAMAGDATTCGEHTPSTCRSYEAFVKNHLGRRPAVYVGANDGMLHAFDASLTTRSGKAVPSPNAGKELFAYMPREVSVKLPDLTRKDSAQFVPTVDGVPVTRDVYFSQATTSPVSTSPGWRTLLVGGLRLGGRGVYALDITDPASMDAGKVLWEFHAHMSDFAAWSDGRSVNPGGKPSNLGYTYGQPNIGRLNHGKWVVLVPGGYFADCARASFDGCHTPPEAENNFSSLFVLDAQTGKLIRELKTSDARTSVTSRGLSSPVLGDYNDDQVDDVSFAGDLDGNLWRYDLSSSNPSNWTVSLAFKPATAGAQPITSMPRLFADPATGKFIVVFGTGKYLGPSDNQDTTVQSVYGIRDIGSTVTRGQLVAQTLSEATADDGKSTARGLTDYAVPIGKGGWYFDLIAPGERVVVTPAALFDSGRVVIQTLIPGAEDPCNPSIKGALMVASAANGGSGGGISALSVSAWTNSGTSVVGGRVDNPRTTSGTMPVVSAMGGGSLLVPGLKLSGSDKLLEIDDALWRRRSWRRIHP